MKSIALIVFVAGSLVAVAARAQGEATPVNPYAQIVSRNIFGLVLPAPGVPPVEVPPLPKITPTGTMTIFGKWQVLFTVTPVAEAARTGKAEFFVLSEGETESEICVVQISPADGTVLFNNHGTFLELPLTENRSK